MKQNRQAKALDKVKNMEVEQISTFQIRSQGNITVCIRGHHLG